jgi:pSer/pThr/pTyr-binding forkhead associated (FHA) protein
LPTSEAINDVLHKQNETPINRERYTHRAALGRPMLIICFKDKRLPPIWIVEKRYSIGSAEDNNLILDDAGIDPRHAQIIKRGDQTFVKDNNSRTGCFVNGQRITNKELVPGDLLRFGKVELEVLDPQSIQQDDFPGVADNAWQLLSDSSLLSGKIFTILPGQPVVIGRDSQCEIVIPGSHLARRHAELNIEGKVLRITNLSAASGTFVNDQRIDTTLAQTGDRLRLDVYTFRLLGPEERREKIRARASIESITIPIERKQTSNEPKRWKTRPTSPGNRMEPTYNTPSHKKEFWLWAVLVAVVASFIATIYLV